MTVNKYTFVSASNLDHRVDMSDIDNWTYDMMPIEFVAKILSSIPRFHGTLQNGEFYSVAFHCLIVCDLVKGAHAYTYNQIEALLHELDEVIFWDIPSPQKRYLFDTCPDFKKLYIKCKHKINDLYGVLKDTGEVVKCFDNILYTLEACSLAVDGFVNIDRLDIDKLTQEQIQENSYKFDKLEGVYYTEYYKKYWDFGEGIHFNQYIEQKFIERYRELTK